MTTEFHSIMPLSAMRSILLAACLLVCGFAVGQPETRFNDSAALVPLVDEEANLNAEELGRLGQLRSRSNYYKQIRLTRRLNFNALHGRKVAFLTLDGEEVKFSGELTVLPDRRRTWSGQSDSGGFMFVSFDDLGVYVTVTEKGKSYLLSSFQGHRLYIVAEITPTPMVDREFSPPSIPASASQTGR
jgi:hypothetical protein